MTELEEGYEDRRLTDWIYEQLEKSKSLREIALQEMREHEPVGDWYWEEVEELVDKLTALKKPIPKESP